MIMKKENEKKTEKKLALIRELIDHVADDIEEEEILHMLLEKKLSADLQTDQQQEESMGQRAADAIARFAGSWTFIVAFTGLLIGWMILNGILATKAFDPYPFILLNLVLSCIAAIQAPLIMMSQNRQAQKDRMQAENAYKINLKSEFILEDLHKKMDRILENQEKSIVDGKRDGNTGKN